MAVIAGKQNKKIEFLYIMEKWGRRQEEKKAC